MNLQNHSLSIIVPVFNEEQTLLNILKKIEVIREVCDLEIIIVNDRSTDNTKKILNENINLYNKVIHLVKNSGKGKAVIEGIKKSSKDYVLIQDADLEYDPIDFESFGKVCRNFDADVVIGSRFVYKNYTRSHYILNKIGNVILTFIFNLSLEDHMGNGIPQNLERDKFQSLAFISQLLNRFSPADFGFQLIDLFKLTILSWALSILINQEFKG